MLIATLPVRDYPSAQQKLFQIAECADGIELCLDYLSHWDFAELTLLRRACALPVIFRLRSRAQGGHYPHSESQRLQEMMALCALNPDYLDVEYDVPVHHIQAIRRCYPAIKVILSYHNFEETPADLEALFYSMYQPDCYAYKIATYAQSTLDALRMLQCVLTLRHRYRIIGLCMGEAGECTRILGPVVGSIFSYAYWDPGEATAPGQLSLQDLIVIYRYRQLNPATKIYALLGDPVHLSVGHLLHNRALDLLSQNAVYVKLHVTPDALPQALQLLRQLPCWGLSITMPLKEAILACLDESAPEVQAIQAVNTVLRQQQRLIGFNTDGLGAIQALSPHGALAGQTLMLIGAGGAARAIAYVALRHQAKVLILNRNLARAEHLAIELGCVAYPLSALTSLTGYTLCVNTLPDHAYQDPDMQALWQSQSLLPNVLAMDVVYQPVETTFLRLVKAAGWRSISGHAMFIAQALLQIQHWFQPEDLHIQKIKALMQKYFDR